MQAAPGDSPEQHLREAAPAQAGDAAMEHEENQEYEEEEEEEESDSSSDAEADRREFGIYQALPVEPGEPDWNAECLDVQEYLRRVRWAAPRAAAAPGGSSSSEPARICPYTSRPPATRQLHANWAIRFPPAGTRRSTFPTW